MKFATLLAISSMASGLAFDGPLPTPVTDLVYATLTGVTPRPTGQIRALPDLFQRQNNANPAVCGYLNGDADFPLSCTSSSTCLSVSSWFGCCAPGSSCAPTTRCIASASVSSCLDNALCYNDALAIACTASSAPFCVNMIAGQLSHWVCGATATSVKVAASATSTTGSPSVRTSEASVIRGGGPNSTGAEAGVKGTVSAIGGDAVVTSVRVGGGAIQTAGVVLGGLAGVVAVFL